MGIRKIYLGDFNNEKKKDLWDKSIDYLREDRGANFLYILPNGSLLTHYRKKMIDQVQALREINIYTFDDIGKRLARRVDSRLISDSLKEMLLGNILKDLGEKGSLVYYGQMIGKRGFIKNLADIISQMKISLIRSDQYLAAIGEEGPFQEIGYIYQAYERLLEENKLMDSEDRFLHTLDGLKDNYRGFLQNIDFIIIDEFYDFRPQELAIIEEISRMDLDIYINMPFRREDNFKSLLDSLTHLEGLGFEIEEVGKDRPSSFESLARTIFTDGARVGGAKVRLTRAPSKRIELRKLAENIKKQLAGGTSLEEMALVVTGESYDNLVEEILLEEKIPHNRSRELDLRDLPMVREVFSILDYNLKRDKDSFLKRIGASYLALGDYRDLEALDYHIREKNLDLGELTEGQLPEDLDELVQNIFTRLDQEGELLRGTKSLADHAGQVLRVLEAYGMEEGIQEIYLELGDYEILQRDLLALEVLKSRLEVLEDLDGCLFDDMDLEDFRGHLYNYLEGEKIRLSEGNEAGLRILSPAMVRGQTYKYIFVVGLTQGDYPSLSSKNFFFKDENSHIFKEVKLDYKNYYERLDKEAMNFSLIISQVEEGLYLSYSENISDNEAGIPSIFLDELIYSLEGEGIGDKLDYEEVDLGYEVKKDLASVTSLEDFSSYLLAKEDRRPEEYAKLNYLDRDRLRRISLRSKGEAERFKGQSVYSGILEDPAILDHIGKGLDGKNFSISFLEGYGRCPFFFMLRSLLGLRPLGEGLEDFSKLDRGTINHAVLQDFYSNHGAEIQDHVLGSRDLDWKEVKAYILARYGYHISLMGLDLEDPIYRLKQEANSQKILAYIEADLDRLKGYKEKLVPLAYEIDFGRQGDFYLEKGDRSLSFTGVIDRIDKFLDEDKYIIMDYKNSAYGLASQEDLARGISLQMPLYLMSQEDRKLVGAFYGIISKGEMEILLVDEGEKEIIGRRRKGVCSQDELDEILERTRGYIFEYVGRIEKGDFGLAPKACSPYCEYRDICRLRKDLEVDYD